MKLYYSPGTCSLAPHIIMQEAGLPVELEQVDLNHHTTAHGENYFNINGRGQVPLLELDNGEYLSEGAIIAQYLADLEGSNRLIPAPSDMNRYRVAEWQNYVSSELHKGFGPLFNAGINSEAKAVLRNALRSKYAWLDSRLAATPFLTGDQFTVADAYLFVVTRWSALIDLDLSDLDNVQSFMDRVARRPAVRAALKAEGLAS